MKDLFIFIFQLFWYIIRNLVCYPFAALSCAWEDSWSRYRITSRLKREAKKKYDDRQTYRNGSNRHLPLPKFTGPGSEPHYSQDQYRKRKRRGHRGGRKHHKKRS